MSVLKSLAIALLFMLAVSEILAPDLFAQTSIAASGTAKPKAGKAQKKAPARRNTPPAPGTGASSEFNVPVPDEDTWYDEDGVQQLQGNAQPRRHSFGLIGAVNYFGSGGGLEYLYAYTPKLSFGGSLLHTQSALKDSSIDGATEFIDATSNSLRAYARYTLFPFLYGGAGLNIDRIQGDYGWKGSAINAGAIQTKFSTTLYALDVFIGSEWRGPWGTYIGADWVGSAIPLGGTIYYDADADVELTSKFLKDKTPNQRLDEETTAQLRIYYLNIRFGKFF